MLKNIFLNYFKIKRGDLLRVGVKSLLVVALLLIGYSFLSAQGRQISCKICHSQERVEFEESIHAKRGISCTDCHGGDPTDVTKESMAPWRGFKGKPTKERIVTMCSSCHSSSTYMEGYGIPTDQLAEYKESSHGIKLLQQHNQNVPSCTGCHEKHRILPPTDARSLMHGPNVLETCSRCHSNPDLMKASGLPTDQYAKFASSVHGKALIEEGNEAAPDCARCHGTHQATPAGGNVVSKVCGQCHLKELDYFNQSPHKQAMSAKGFSECVSCHSSHDIQFPSSAFYDSLCLGCHSRETEAYKRGQQIKALLVNAKGEIEDAERELNRVKLKGLDVLDDELLLEDARSKIVEAVPVQHTLLLSEIQDLTEEASSLAEEVKLHTHKALESLRMRRVVLGFLWLAVFGVVLALYLEKKRVEKRQILINH